MVVGGGEVAERKVERLIECGAEVAVIGRELTKLLASMKNAGMITHILDEYRSEYIEGAFLVVGATDSDVVNETIYADAKKKGILVNIVDDPARCDFIVPAIMQRGDLAIAISTGGKSPALARTLRERLEEQYGAEYGIFLDIMGQLRGRIIARGMSPEENKKIFESLVNSNIIDSIKEKDWGRVRKLIVELADEELGMSFFHDY